MSSRITDSVVRGDVFSWTVQDITQYLDYQSRSASERLQQRQSPRDGFIVEVYTKVIKACLRSQRPILANGDVYTPVTVRVPDAVGPHVHLTDFYSAFGYIIGMCELDVHRHADDEGFHRQLVIRFAKLCWTMHSYFFFPERNPTRGRRPQHLPSKAFVIFGPVSRMEVVHLEFWDGDHFCSLSTSVPGVDERDERRARVDFVGLKEQVRQIRLNDMLINVPELHTHLAETDIGYPFPPGNCAEAIPQARILGQGRTTLKGLCVDIHMVGRCRSIQEVYALPPPGPDERACAFCAAVNSCPHRIVQDLARPSNRPGLAAGPYRPDLSHAPAPRR